MIKRMIMLPVIVTLLNSFLTAAQSTESVDSLITKKIGFMKQRKAEYDNRVDQLTTGLADEWVSWLEKTGSGRVNVWTVLAQIKKTGNFGENNVSEQEIKNAIQYQSLPTKKMVDLLISELKRSSELYVKIIKEDLEGLSQFPDQRDTINNELQKLGIKKGIEIKKP